MLGFLETTVSYILSTVIFLLPGIVVITLIIMILLKIYKYLSLSIKEKEESLK